MSRFDQIYDRRGTGAIKYDTLEHAGFGADALPLWVADMDFPAPECVGEALRRMTDPGIYGYTMTGTAYNAAVTGWFERRFGWKPEEDWLVTTPGVVYAICTAIRAFTEPGEAVMCLLPVYSHFFTAVEDNGRRPVYGHLKRENGHYEIDFEELERLLDEERPRLLILCSPHNPVGRVWKREELERLGRLCFDRGVLVVADEIHCDFVYPGQRHIPFLSLGPEFEQNTICCTAPSKTFNLAGLQCSNIFIPNPVLRAAFRREITAQGGFGVNSAGAAACMAAYNGGADWLDELLVYLRGNYNFLRAFLADRLPKLTAGELEGTYLAWVDVSALNLSEEEQLALLKRAGVRLSMGGEYGAGGETFWRVNLACPKSTLRAALERIAAEVEKL